MNKFNEMTIEINVFSDETIEEIANYNNNKLTHDGDSADAVLYVFLTSIARIMALTNHSSNPNNLIQTILKLEENVGYADLASLSIQELVAKEKQLFYILYAGQAVAFETLVLNSFSYVNHISLVFTFF